MGTNTGALSVACRCGQGYKGCSSHGGNHYRGNQVRSIRLVGIPWRGYTSNDPELDSPVFSYTRRCIRSEMFRACSYSRGRGKAEAVSLSESILREEAERRSITVADIRGKNRRAKYAEARRAICQTLTGLGFSLTEIGQLINRDRGTVWHHIHHAKK